MLLHEARESVVSDLVSEQAFVHVVVRKPEKNPGGCISSKEPLYNFIMGERLLLLSANSK